MDYSPFFILMGFIAFFYTCNVVFSYYEAKAKFEDILVNLDVANEHNKNLLIKVGSNQLKLPYKAIVYREGFTIYIENLNSNSITPVKFSDIGRISMTVNNPRNVTRAKRKSEIVKNHKDNLFG